MPKQFDPLNTSVAEIHYLISEDASWIANELLSQEPGIPNKYKGYVFMNSSPYAKNALSIQIAPEYDGAPPQILAKYQAIGLNAMKQALAKNQKLFAGLILGEAKAGRNYFERTTQTPRQLFD